MFPKVGATAPQGALKDFSASPKIVLIGKMLN
jgi:hypothetical protein